MAVATSQVAVPRRLRGRLLVAAAWLVPHLPERPLLFVADLLGDAWYRLDGRRRRQARRNLARVVAWMAERGAGDPRARAAASDPRALNRLVRDAFRHAARYYVHLLWLPAVDEAYMTRHLVPETPEVVDDALRDPGGMLFVGLHLGWFELAALYLVTRTRRGGVVPTEVLDDPDLQALLAAARERLGIRLVELSAARRELGVAIRRGYPVGLIADRDLTGGGIVTPFFGRPAKLPVGPALIALETGAIARVFGTWLEDDGRHHARAQEIPMPADGSRRDRVEAYLAAQVRVFEHYIANAPEQWLSVFHPIWDDIVEGAP